MRQIILDTETTGIDPQLGHKVIEIGCVELLDRKLTGSHFHVYLNPEREVDEGAFRVHGISTEFLKDKPLFKDIAADFLQFVEGAELIIHNAAFDVGFLNAELKQIHWKQSLDAYCTVIDTLMLARKKHPGQRNSLDALCKRYDIDNSNRQLHGALLDAEILALVYLAMTGGQSSLFTEPQTNEEPVQKNRNTVGAAQLFNPVVIYHDAEEQLSHQEFLKLVATKSSNNYWN